MVMVDYFSWGITWGGTEGVWSSDTRQLREKGVGNSLRVKDEG